MRPVQINKCCARWNAWLLGTQAVVLWRGKTEWHQGVSRMLVYIWSEYKHQERHAVTALCNLSQCKDALTEQVTLPATWTYIGTDCCIMHACTHNCNFCMAAWHTRLGLGCIGPLAPQRVPNMWGLGLVVHHFLIHLAQHHATAALHSHMTSMILIIILIILLLIINSNNNNAFQKNELGRAYGDDLDPWV